MNETEWLTTTNLGALQDWCRQRLRGRRRKFRLFGCACCRRLWHLLPDPRSRAAVEAAERYADGLIDKQALPQVRRAAMAATRAAPRQPDPPRLAWTAESAAQILINQPTDDFFIAAAIRAAYAADGAGLRPYLQEEAEQARLLRDLFGNPFRPVAFDPVWRTGTVVSLGRRLYDTGDFAGMPILADALQDAGCENADLLGHCRGPGPHVRGCWAVDLVLGLS
jgi:hypothetical protein